MCTKRAACKDAKGAAVRRVIKAAVLADATAKLPAMLRHGAE